MANTFSEKSRIHGHEVQINIIYDKDARLSLRAASISLFLKLSKSGLARKLSSEEKSQKIDENAAVLYCKEVIDQILEYDPEIITSDPFSINVRIVNRPAGFADYDPLISSHACAFINLNSNYLKQLLFKVSKETDAMARDTEILNNLREALLHELRHHTELKFNQDFKQMVEKYIKRKQTFFFGPFFLAYKTRSEAVTTFEQLLHQNLHIRLGALATYVRGLEGDDKALLRVLTDAYFYDVGPLMCYIIMLHRMKSNCRTQEQRELLNKQTKLLFEGLYADSMELSLPSAEWVKHMVGELRHMSPERFMREYEIACKTLRIPDRFRILTWHNYKKAMKKAYIKYMREIEKRGFVSSMVHKVLDSFASRFITQMISKSM